VNRQEDVRLLRDALLMVPRAESASPPCLDDVAVAAFAEARLDAGARQAALTHLASCQRCRSAVASVARALADRAVAREVARAERTRTARIVRTLIPVAAAAVLVVLVWPRPGADGGFGHRAPTITTVAAPAPVRPVGAVSEAPVLTWRSVAGADRYRVTLFSAGGAVLYERWVRDTSASLPDSVMPAPGQRYLWKVEARTGFERWVASDLVEFSVVEGVR
jgi:hypothetical protein